MNFGLLFFQFLPLFLYTTIAYWKGFKAGILAAMGAAILMLGYNYLMLGEIDNFSIGECGLILFMGIISLKMNNERYFKFQPTVLAVIFCTVLLYFESKGTPLLVRYVPHIEKLITGPDMTLEMKKILAEMHTPNYTKMLAKLSKVLIFLIGAHGLLMAYAAIRLSTPKWFMLRLSIYPALVVAVVFVGASTLAF